MADRRLAIIAGGNGVIGRALAEHLESRDGWDVVSLSRKKMPAVGRVRPVQLDLLDARSTMEGLAEVGKPTHLFFAAYQDRSDPGELADLHLSMLQNFVRAGAAGSALERVILYQGAKYYGVHLGKFKTPAVEDDPRHIPPNFYYAMEDWLRAESAGQSWSPVVLRPDVVCGSVIGGGFNIVMLIAVYACISKALGVPLRFPGSPEAYTALVQVTDAAHLARASEWAAVSAPGDEAYNVTNGDLFRWQQVWPLFAAFFDMPVGDLQMIPIAETMKDKAPVWDRIVREHNLTPTRYDGIALWNAGDFVLRCGYDVVSSTTKIRRAGFGGVVDSGEMFLSPASSHSRRLRNFGVRARDHNRHHPFRKPGCFRYSL
jgi:nucleoside-diphosphate-sugar epimerase